MSKPDILQGSRWEWAYIVECTECGWYTISQDYGWTKNAGKVHVHSLEPDHTLVSVEPRKVYRDSFGTLGWRE